MVDHKSINLKDYYEPRNILDVYLNKNEEVKQLLEKLKDRVFYASYWGSGDDMPVKKTYEENIGKADSQLEFIIWPHRTAFSRVVVITIIDIKNKKTFIHTPTKSSASDDSVDREKDEVVNYLKDINRFQRLNRSNPDVDASENAAPFSKEESDYISILYFINALKLIDNNTYASGSSAERRDPYQIPTSSWDIPAIIALPDGTTENISPVGRVSEEYKELLKDLPLSPTLEELPPLEEIIENVDVYTDEDKELFATLGITDNSEKRDAVKECQRLVDLVNEYTNEPNKSIKLFFAHVLPDGTRYNYSNDGYGLGDGDSSESFSREHGSDLYLKLDRYDKDNNFNLGLVLWSLTHELTDAYLAIKNQVGKYDYSFPRCSAFWGWKLFDSSFSFYSFIKNNIKDRYWKDYMSLSLPSLYPSNISNDSFFWEKSIYTIDTDLTFVYDKFPSAKPTDLTLEQLTQTLNIDNLPISVIDGTWRRVSSKILEIVDDEFIANTYNDNNYDFLWSNNSLKVNDDGTFTILIQYRKDSKLETKLQELVANEKDNYDQLKKNNEELLQKIADKDNKINELQQRIDNIPTGTGVDNNEELTQLKDDIEKLKVEKEALWNTINTLYSQIKIIPRGKNRTKAQMVEEMTRLLILTYNNWQAYLDDPSKDDGFLKPYFEKNPSELDNFKIILGRIKIVKDLDLLNNIRPLEDLLASDWTDKQDYDNVRYTLDKLCVDYRKLQKRSDDNTASGRRRSVSNPPPMTFR